MIPSQVNRDNTGGARSTGNMALGWFWRGYFCTVWWICSKGHHRPYATTELLVCLFWI